MAIENVYICDPNADAEEVVDPTEFAGAAALMREQLVAGRKQTKEQLRPFLSDSESHEN